MATSWSKLWEELNKRQQTYLQAVYEEDQAAEDFYKHKWNVYKQGYPPPASEWRWILYGPVEPPSKLYSKLRAADLVDPGTGSSFESLDKRGYLKRKWEPDKTFPELELLYVQMTPRGRRLIREALGQQPKPKRIKGRLTQAQWRALKALYQAGEQGARSDGSGYYYKEKRFSWPALLRLRDYQPEPLMRETSRPEQFTRYRDIYKPEKGTYTETKFISYAQITKAGQQFYEQHKAEYEQLYPGVKL
jgi:hypothetical protein